MAETKDFLTRLWCAQRSTSRRHIEEEKYPISASKQTFRLSLSLAGYTVRLRSNYNDPQSSPRTRRDRFSLAILFRILAKPKPAHSRIIPSSSWFIDARDTVCISTRCYAYFMRLIDPRPLCRIYLVVADFSYHFDLVSYISFAIKRAVEISVMRTVCCPPARASTASCVLKILFMEKIQRTILKTLEWKEKIALEKKTRMHLSAYVYVYAWPADSTANYIPL